jgi:hypothetical protein
MKNILKKLGFITLGLIIFGVSLCFYIDAGNNLTPPSVSVSGYYRSDGTYVRPYNRRPPGGARHDSPYETERTITLITMIGSGIFSGVCYYILYKDVRNSKPFIEDNQSKH